jgi:hydroxyacylglutathione hydrolase
MSILVLPAFGDNYMYLIADTGRAVAVDPSDAGPVLGALEKNGLVLDACVVTHAHGDHCGGVRELMRSTGCAAYGPDGCGRNVSAVHENMTVTAGPIRLQVIETPGHSNNDMCYYLASCRALFTGDTLFACGCGRIFGGGAAVMWRSLSKLARFDDDVSVYCGHEYTEENVMFALAVEPANTALRQRYDAVRKLRTEGLPTVPSTIGLEKKTNPFLRSGEPAVKKNLGMAQRADEEVFAELRRRKDRF